MHHLLLAILLILQPAKPLDSLDAFRRAAMSAKPGDRVLLAPGNYEGSIWLESLKGTEQKPIVLAGADPANPPTITGKSECLHLAACHWITIEHLTLKGASGNGLNIDDGGKLDQPAQGVTLRALKVHDIGPTGNCDGIKLSGLAGFIIEDCTIERWGKGGSGIDMVGCRDGVIRNCSLTHGDTDGSNGIQTKGGTQRISIRQCRFEHAGRRALNIGGSTGLQFFRPGGKHGGFEAKDITVEGCTIIGSEAALAFVGVDGAIARFNTIYHPTRWAIRILQETREPGFVPSRRGTLADNIIVFDIPTAKEPNIGDATEPSSFTFERNLWYCDTDTSQSKPTLPAKETGGIYGQDPKLKDPARGDLTPAPDGIAARTGATALPAQ
ncbi:MAG: right-handed parallel beta-helix repeat-containing protein [Phycisphaerales bacterium]|nr:right-handed parallel beta-helix repeat-containing protein [Phycisphaerales bacterium]